MASSAYARPSVSVSPPSKRDLGYLHRISRSSSHAHDRPALTSSYENSGGWLHKPPRADSFAGFALNDGTSDVHYGRTDDYAEKEDDNNLHALGRHGTMPEVRSNGEALFEPVKAAFDQSAASYAPPEASTVVFEQVAPGAQSRLTDFLLQHTVQWPLLHAIMKEKDSRRIFYFMSLNFAFMLIQAFYGYVTDSLGLLSDSIHMFFDCVALAVGLFAAVASKWPPSERFPYGFGKIETLSGFANGIFLILISVEIMVEAVERLLGGRETQRLLELFVVSTLGLLVNLVGMFSFGHHHHHGHGHGHSHSHGHKHADDFSSLSKKHDHHDGHEHNHSHSHTHDHGHNHTHDHSHGHAHGHDHSHGHDHGHSHSHDNENMYGIYLHVLADTLGSAAVIVSTVLTHFWAWAGWDPLASFLIAVLILGSAVPLVTSSARRLLLTIPDTVEYALRETLAGVPGLRGVASYAAPRFWIDDRAAGEGAREACEGAGGEKLLGVMHVVAVRGADMDDVRDRARGYLLDKGIDAVVQVEREGDGNCWCEANRPAATGASSASISIGGGGHGAKPSINF